MTNAEITEKIDALFDKIDDVHIEIDTLINKLVEQGGEY